MPAKGTGRTSPVETPNHPYFKYGLWWKSEADFLEWKEVKKGKREPPKTRRRAHNAGKGITSEKWRPSHQFKGWGLWWRSEEEFLKHRDYTAKRVSAYRAGMAVDDFIKMKAETQDAIAMSKKLEAKFTERLRYLKAKHGLPDRCNRTHLLAAFAKTGDPEIKEFLYMDAHSKMNAEEKLHRIRELFLDGHKPLDIMYQTALIVGIRLGEKQ